MNNFFKNIIIGLFSVRSNLTRVILTASGLTIGIFTVSLVSAAVSSIDKEFAKSMDYYGNDKVYVGTWPWSFDFDWWKYRNRPKIEESSLEYISQALKFDSLDSEQKAELYLVKGDIYRETKDYDNAIKFNIWLNSLLLFTLS